MLNHHRLDDLDIQPFQIASAVLGVMATRLIRTLCEHCRQPYTLTKKDYEAMEITEERAKGKQIYTAGPGCDKCHNMGYSGRAAIHELLIMDDRIRDLLTRTQDAGPIRKAAIESGMVTLRESAISKVLEGRTSIEEAISKTQTEELEVMDEPVTSSDEAPESS